MKCKHYKYCEWYKKDNLVCNKDAGKYSIDRYAGCWYKQEDKNKKNIRRLK